MYVHVNFFLCHSVCFQQQLQGTCFEVLKKKILFFKEEELIKNIFFRIGILAKVLCTCLNLVSPIHILCLGLFLRLTTIPCLLTIDLVVLSSCFPLIASVGFPIASFLCLLSESAFYSGQKMQY